MEDVLAPDGRTLVILFGGMPQELALRSLRLFAERVIPALAPVGAPKPT